MSSTTTFVGRFNGLPRTAATAAATRRAFGLTLFGLALVEAREGDALRLAMAISGRTASCAGMTGISAADGMDASILLYGRSFSSGPLGSPRPWTGR